MWIDYPRTEVVAAATGRLSRAKLRHRATARTERASTSLESLKSALSHAATFIRNVPPAGAAGGSMCARLKVNATVLGVGKSGIHPEVSWEKKTCHGIHSANVKSAKIGSLNVCVDEYSLFVLRSLDHQRFTARVYQIRSNNANDLSYLVC